MSGSPDELVQVRDRRELPFFQVHLAAVRAIRETASGPRLVRAIGFYALLCQIANEQRHSGEHAVAQVSYDTLTRRGQVSRSTVKALLDNLAHAVVTGCERVNDSARGAAVSLLHLLISEGGWTAVTVAMAEHLATERPSGHLLRDLGLVVVLLELCSEQRAEHGGLAAETTRVAIAERAGLTVDRLDDCNQILEHAGLLSIERRRAANGGRHLPSTYTLHEAPTVQGGQRVLAGRQTGTGRAADEYGQGGRRVPAGRQTGTGRAANRYWQGSGRVPAGRNFRHPRYRFAALYRAHERTGRRKGFRNPSPFSSERDEGGGGSRFGVERVVRGARLGMGAGARREPPPDLSR